ncbi:DNA/RNA polymerase [Mucidula mucida]|nr:DNA/RNA polymerase [Mucidula mucida]
MSKAPNSSNETDSLIRRLAGPSTGKAGLAKDQTEINRIIAEASKGSKFYENEKRKDQDLTERIDKILKLRDELTKGVDLRKIERATDVLLKEFEEQRDLSQFIVHVDMDAFYASVELLFNPILKGKPFAVGYGVLTTASYDARKFGVRSGMPGFIAKKLCPDLIFVANNFSRYSDMSKKVMTIFERYDPDMCAAGCDEGYLNITSYCNEHNMTPDACVEEIRKRVQEETKLTVSAGIAPNKMLAKICSDKNKPNGQFHLSFDSKAIIAFMHDLSIRKVPGIGRVNERLLDSIGIKTCGDIFIHRAVISLMDKQFGLHFLLRTHLGIASNVVHPIQREERKSIGSERTFNPIDDKEKLLQKLEEISVELKEDMARNGWTGRTITLKYKLDTYQGMSRIRGQVMRSLDNEEGRLFKIGKDLLLPEFPLKLRLIGLRVTKLKDLRSSEPISGIKRFFEPGKGEQSESKRQKTVAASEWEETMPGFHEDDDTDLPEDQARPEEHPPAPTTRPPNSEPARPSQEAVKVSIKPRSTVLRKAPAATSVKASQDCPICGKTLLTDNQGLNDHIDFCLSKGVILQAQSEASVESRSRQPKSKRKGH